MFQVTCSIIVVLFVVPGWITVLHGVEVELAVPCNKTCVHGGQCVITPDPTCSGSGFKQTCNCPPSYTGEFCENFLYKVECDKICENGGQCVVNFTNDGCTSFLTSCVCPPTCYGELCEFFPICDPPCKAGQGECVVLRNSQLAPHLTDGAYCNCSMSATGYYYGNQCQHYQQTGTCDPPCRNGGECNYDGRCNCQQRPNSNSPYESFTGCSEFDPVCNPACQNGGICYSGSCECTSTDLGYYYGFACEQFQDNTICDPPCTAGQGECVVLRNSQLAPHLTDGAYCNCSMSATGYYYGKQCQHYQQKGTCDPPCRNGGECNYDGRCNCQQRPNSNSRNFESFTGCSEFDPVCDPACKNGGICYSGSCECTSTDLGYYNGSACEQFQDNICNLPCQNGGTCTRGYCRCRHSNSWEYYGPGCERFRDYNICSPPCEDGSVCQYGSCRCISNATQYRSGSDCSDVTECMGTCLNGGTCDTGGKCRCLKEYTGVNCETYTGCPCLNNGRCIDGECDCVANETGMFQGALCGFFTFYYPRYPPVLNGGVWSVGNIYCPYDDVGYFHGNQCEKYSLNNCISSCIEPEVCIEEGCICPYNLTERRFTYTNDKGRCKGQYYF